MSCALDRFFYGLVFPSIWIFATLVLLALAGSADLSEPAVRVLGPYLFVGATIGSVIVCRGAWPDRPERILALPLALLAYGALVLS